MRRSYLLRAQLELSLNLRPEQYQRLVGVDLPTMVRVDTTE